jgi:hypothetical protein
MLYLSSITFYTARLKAYSINTGFFTRAVIPEVSGLEATGSRQRMRIPRVRALYLAGAVLLPKHKEAAIGAHSVTVKTRNQKESRAIESETWTNPFCVENMNISSARRLPRAAMTSHGPEYDGPQSVSAALASGQSQCHQCTPQICVT